MAHIGMIIGQFLGLRGNRVCHLGAAITHIHAVEPGECVEQLDAVAVGDVDALAAADDSVNQLAAGELPEMGRRVEEIGAVPFGELVVAQHE